MQHAGWYVAQVETGREQLMCDAIKRACVDCEYQGSLGPEPLLMECFSPSFVSRQKYRGQWQDVTKLLLPGYVIAVTRDPVRLRNQMFKIRDFTRLLLMGETFVPLRDDERTWIEEFTSSNERVIPISIGYREGDTLVVTDGPLKGREAMVKKIIRKKCLAVLELNVGGKHVTTTVGLAVLPQKEAQPT